MADISQITLPSGTTYNLKDAWAREQLQTITGGNAIVFRGVSSVALTDTGNQNPVVNGETITIKKTGDLYFYNKEEFIYGSDNKWHSLGPQLQNLGNLAYKNTVDVKYHRYTISSEFTGSNSTFSGTYTPKGSVSQPTFQGDVLASTASYKPEGNVTIYSDWKPIKLQLNNTTYREQDEQGIITNVPFTDDQVIKYTPSGTVSRPSFTGQSFVSTGTFTPTGSITTPTISVLSAGSTTTIKNPTKATVAKTVEAAVPSSTVKNEITYYSVANQNLTLYKIGYTTGDSITTSNVTVKTGDASYQSDTPSFNGSSSNISVSGTPVGTISQPIFSGFGSTFSGLALKVGETLFNGKASTITAQGIPSGTVSKPTFSGTSTGVTVTGIPNGSVENTATASTASAIVTYS